MKNLEQLRSEHTEMGETIARLEKERGELTVTFGDLSVGDAFVDYGVASVNLPSIKVSSTHEVYWAAARECLVYKEAPNGKYVKRSY